MSFIISNILMYTMNFQIMMRNIAVVSFNDTPYMLKTVHSSFCWTVEMMLWTNVS